MNIVLVVAAGAALAVIHDRYQRAEGRARAAEVARFELKRMTDTFNYRLNELREELFHLYGEQSNLARALNEAERERLIFYRRDHLAAYGILVPGDGGAWEVQKYYVRETAKKAMSDDEIVGLLKDTMATLHAPGFGLKRLAADVKALGTTWVSAGSNASDAYGVAFESSDDSGKPFGVVGVFRPSYVFPFCKSFGDPLGAMPVSAYVLNDRGVAVCHSQPQYDGAAFKDFSFYSAVQNPPPNGLVRFANLVGNPVVAAVKKVDPGGLVFVSEATEVTPWATAVPYDQLGWLAGALALTTLIVSILMAKVVLAKGPAARAPASPEAAPSLDGLGVELHEFTKLRHELKDLESTVLDMQTNQAFVAGYQRAASELDYNDDLGRFTLEYLAQWGLAIAWLVFDSEGKKLRSRGQVNFGGEPDAGFQLGLDPVPAPERLAHDEELRGKVAKQLGLEAVLLHGVFSGAALEGIFVIAGAGPEHASRLETLPQITQIFAMLGRVRRQGGSS